MYIMTIIPIAKGISRDELSYFSAKEISLGTLVTVPFGKRSIKGIVVDQQPVRNLKGSIKQNNFALRNITTIHQERLPRALFSAGQKCASIFAQPVGAILETMIPNQLFDYYLNHSITEPNRQKAQSDIGALQMPYKDRLSWYKTALRENMAKNKSTMIIAPSIAHAEKIYKELSIGITDYTTILHSKKTKKYIDITIKKILSSQEPLLHIATAPFASCVRDDWEMIIIESSSSSLYRYPFKPIFEIPSFIESFARDMQVHLIYGDILLNPDIRKRIIDREITDYQSMWHVNQPDLTALVDMKSALPETSSFDLLHPRTKKLITRSIDESSRIVLITGRKGLAPLTICTDCGSPVACPVCQTPLVLHKKKTSDENIARIYMCHHCMHMTPPIDRCANCTSWKLSLFGISTESLADYLKKHFPEATIFIADKDQGSTTHLQKTIASWTTTPKSILIGTPAMLSLIDQSPYGAIISIDSLLSLPHYTSSIHTLYSTLLFLEKITDRAIIQTRMFHHETIQALASGNILDFITQESQTRKQLSYPPFATIVTISTEIKKDHGSKTIEYLETILDDYHPEIILKKSRQIDTLIIRGMIRLESSLWEDQASEIHVIIQELRNDFTIEVNPESIL